LAGSVDLGRSAGGGLWRGWQQFGLRQRHHDSEGPGRHEHCGAHHDGSRGHQRGPNDCCPNHCCPDDVWTYDDWAYDDWAYDD